MNYAVHNRNPYSDVKAPIRDERSSEYLAFAKITHRLHVIDSEDLTAFADLASALHENQRLWNILAVDVAGDGNGLPKNLRAQIFYLSEFTRFHSARVIAEKLSPNILVEINTAIMRGLRPLEVIAK